MKSDETLQSELDAVRKEAELHAAAALAAKEELNYFVYAASHDLQSPLRTVTTYAQLLQRELGGQDSVKEFTNFIIAAAREMSTLVRDLGLYSRAGTTPQFTEVNLNLMFQYALHALADEVQSSGAIVTSDPLPTVTGDERQLTSVLENLIGNAIRYRGESRPVIHVSTSEKDGFHTISVSDNGPGIAPEYHVRIFEPFKRLHGKNIPGSGLGLAISRKTLAAHGGRIWVESDGQSGSKFHFSIPS